MIDNNKIIRIEDCLKENITEKTENIRILIERLKVNDKTQELVGQISDSEQTAF